MLKVMIVDDEQWSVDYMLNLVDWSQNGAEVVATFNNAMDAIGYYNENPDIDIIFIDVQMPGITGLEFLKSVGSSSENTSFVIISSYDYFNYAQEALRSGAKDYLLKPVECSDIERILRDTAGRRENDTKQAIEQGNINVMPLGSVQKRIGDIWKMAHSQRILCCVTDAPDAEMGKICKAAFSQECDVLCYHSVWHHAFFVRLCGDYASNNAQALKNIGYRFGLYIAESENETVKDMLVKAKSAYEGIFFSPASNVCVYDNEHEKWSAASIFSVKRYLEERQIGPVHGCIDDFYGELEVRCIQADAGILFYNKILEFLSNSTESTVKSGEHFLIDIQHAKKKFGKRDDLVLFLQCLVDEWGTDFAGEIQMFKAKDFIPKIQKYINENCQNELNLSNLAKEFMMSSKYLSSVFKKTTGMNLNRYINLARVKKAAAMLEQTDISIQDVSYLCGYNDCSYFTKIFKQLIGLTPSDYRISKRGEEI